MTAGNMARARNKMDHFYCSGLSERTKASQLCSSWAVFACGLARRQILQSDAALGFTTHALNFEAEESIECIITNNKHSLVLDLRVGMMM